MIFRIVFTLGLALLGLAVTFAQLDQQSRISPAHAAAVPDLFSGNAARERSKLALQAGLPEVALAEAQTQVALRPIPAESMTTLALAALANEDAGLAEQALGAASQRGWREPISQLASGESALQQGAYGVASQRIVALLSSGNLQEPAYALLARLLETPEGRAAFAERLVAFGRWQDNSLAPASRIGNPANWAQTLSLAQAEGAHFDCNRLRTLANWYDRQRLAEERAAFWPGNCPAGRSAR